MEPVLARSLTPEANAKKRLLGSRNPNWKPDRSTLIRPITCLEGQIWRRAVYKRDDYTCQMCGKRGVTLNAHHILAFAKHPELRFDVANGLTLCVSCHKTTDSYGVKGWINNSVKVILAK